MAKHKMKRVGISMDMTAMVDVAFLLLTFFMLTTQFRQPEVVPIELPSSHAEVKLPTSNIMMISVSKTGDVYIGADGANDTDVPGANGDVQIQPSDLKDVLVQLRSANTRLRSVIKADAGAPYGTIEDVMTALKDARITRFSLITSLEG